jgi:hypothetical protein
MGASKTLKRRYLVVTVAGDAAVSRCRTLLPPVLWGTDAYGLGFGRDHNDPLQQIGICR